MSFLRKYYTVIIALILIITPTIILSFNLRHSGGTGFIRSLVLETAAPLENIVNSSMSCIGGIWKRYIFLVGLEEENRKLRREIFSLRGEINRYREMYLDGIRLKKLLKLKEDINCPSVVAKVTGGSRSSVFKTILINRGTRDGLKEGCPVLTDGGVVGRIVEASWNVSRVLLLIDNNSNIDALVQESRAQGILQGRGAEGCILKYVQSSEEVREGDSVISSGLAGVFPKGLLLGVVRKVKKEPFGLFQDIQVSPSVDLLKLEEVIVILSDKEDRR